MVNNKLNLLVENSIKMDNIKGTMGMGAFKKCTALNLTLKDESADVLRINEAVDIIKKNTSIFSNFRGNNLLTTAVCISLENNMNESLDDITSIYEKLKKCFTTSQYLVLASQVIYSSRHRINVDETIANTRVAYDYMKKSHMFLTGSEDVGAAAMIASTSSNLEETFKDIEECYELLKEKILFSSNNIQSLTHILSFIDETPEQKVRKVNLMKRALEEKAVPLKSYSLPLLGIVPFITDDYDSFATQVHDVSNALKKEKGFGSFTLGSLIRNMIAVGIVASDCINNLSEEESDKLINTANNVTLTIIIAMEIAASAAAAGAAAAAASSGS